nr:hypothetical protein [Pirellula sp.]
MRVTCGIDRGAIDRVDQIGPLAVLQRPLDNDASFVDEDRFNTYIKVRSGNLDYFEILLDERQGTGPDPATINRDNVILTENGRMLLPGVDYVFGYSFNSRTIRLTPLAGFWRQDSVYELTLINKPTLRIVAPSDATGLANGQTITVTLTGGGTRSFPLVLPPTPTFDPFAFANQLVKSLHGIAPGVKAYTLAGGVVFVEGITAISDLTSLPLSPIRDLASNLLQPNRANSLTQFTILMPEVVVDYGDAVGGSTLQADNGVRHALYPSDARQLVLGAFVDSDFDGAPSLAADGDDFDSGLDLGTLSPFVSIDPNGPAQLVTRAVSANTFGKTLTIIDAIGSRVTYQFVDATNPLTDPSFVPVDLTGLSTSTQVASALRSAILGTILNGTVTDIHAQSTGNVVSLGGSSEHEFDLSGAGSEIERVLSGRLGLTIDSNLTGLAAGQALSITDGSGNTVGFQVLDTNPSAPITAVLAGNYAVRVDLAVATSSDLASALAVAMNAAIAD